MPELIRMYIRHSAIGFGIAAIFVAMLLAFNVQNLWYLVTHSKDGPLAVFLLWFMHGIVFAGVQFAWAVMNLARSDREGGGGRPMRAYLPVRVRAEGERRR